MRSILDGSEIRNSVFWDVKLGITKQTLAGTYTMATNMGVIHFLDPNGTSRTVLLPVVGKGLMYVIMNTGTVAANLTIKDSTNTTTVAILQNGIGIELWSDGVTWFTLSDVGAGGGAGPVLTGDVTAYTVLAADSGRTIISPDVTASITMTLPTPDEGLNYTFWYGGVAADAQNMIITGGAGNFLKGGVVTLDEDAGPASDEVIAVFANGTSHITLTITTPKCGTEVKVICDGALWYVNGRVNSAASAAFS